jgi:hypothetical protein
MFIKTFLVLILIYMSNCTTIGFHNYKKLNSYDFSKNVTYKLCFYKDESISEERVQVLSENLSTELLLYNISLETNVIGTIKRPGFNTEQIYNYIIKIPIPKECDRVMVLLERNIFDFIVHIFLPEIMGLVEGTTRTRGFIFADYLSINIITGGTPSKILIHENYHFLGCDHNIIMNDCYLKIFQHKESAIENFNNNNLFFPSLDHKNKFITNREFINYYIKNK